MEDKAGDSSRFVAGRWPGRIAEWRSSTPYPYLPLTGIGERTLDSEDMCNLHEGIFWHRICKRRIVQANKMKKLIILMALFSLSGCQNHTKHSALKDVSYKTSNYEKKYVSPERLLKGKQLNDETNRLIVNHRPAAYRYCSEKWAGDYSMELYCQKKQDTALFSFFTMKVINYDIMSNGTDSSESIRIYESCQEKWSNDFTMAEYCAKKEEAAKHEALIRRIKAARELGAYG